MLPVRLRTRHGESLPGYVRRLAAANYYSELRLLNRCGLGARSRPPAFWGLIATEDTTTIAETRWGMDSGELRRMVLESLPGINLRDLHSDNPRGAARNAQRTQWLLLSETKHCAECWRDGSRGRLDWMLPWAAVCEQHARLLTNTRPSPTSDLQAPEASPELLAAHAEAMRPARETRPTLWGKPAAAFDVWQAWRGVACLLAAGSGVNAWTGRPWLTPPKRVTDIAGLLVLVAPIIQVATTQSAAQAVIERAPGLRDLHVRGALPDCVGDQPALRPLLAETSKILGGTSTALRVQSQQISLLYPEARIEWMPTLAPKEHLPAAWAARQVPAHALGQAVVAAASARLAGAATWREAGQHLGLDPERLTKWAQYVLRHFTPDGKRQLAAAAERNLQTFTAGKQLQQRPERPLTSAAELTRWRDSTEIARWGAAPAA